MHKDTTRSIIFHDKSLQGFGPWYARLDGAQREQTRKELAWLETDLIRRRKRLACWTLRKTQAETLSGIREELRQSAFYFHARAEELVASGKKLRAYLVIELREQHGHQPAYDDAH